MFRKTVLAATLAVAALAGGTASAATVTVGNAATNRALADGFSNFAIGFTNIGFVEGTLTAWDVYIERIVPNAATGTVALLVLSDLGGGSYKVNGVDARSASLGLNSFAGLSIATLATDILGVFIGTAKVSYDLINQPSGPDVFTGNNVFTGAPNEGDILTLTAGSTSRIYSVNATVSPVPLPAGGLLLIGALGGLAALRRRKMAA